MSKEAMKLALEALEGTNMAEESKMISNAIKALKEALAQSRSDVKQSDSVEQGEPFGWYDMEHGEIRDVEWNRQKPTYEGVWRPLYTTPQQRKPLTDEQILRLLSKIDECAVRLPRGLREFARAIEAAHGICPSDFKE